MGSESPVASGYQISPELATKVPILMPIPLFVPFPWLNSSNSIKLSYGATSLFLNAARFYFPPEGLLDLQNRENQDMKSKSRVQTCPNLEHFSVEQM